MILNTKRTPSKLHPMRSAVSKPLPSSKQQNLHVILLQFAYQFHVHNDQITHMIIDDKQLSGFILLIQFIDRISFFGHISGMRHNSQHYMCRSIEWQRNIIVTTIIYAISNDKFSCYRLRYQISQFPL